MLPAFLDWPAPLPFAHRGGAGDHPENTLAAFAAAVELGYAYVETDVHATTDGEVMAFHDDILERVTDRTGRIDALHVAEVETADAGFHFSRDGGDTHPFRGTGVRIPRLSELLERWPTLRFNIDPKAETSVEPLITLLRRMNAFDRVCVGSFSDARLRRVRRLSGGRLCTSMGPTAVTVMRLATWTGRIPRLSANCIQIPITQFGIRLVTHRSVAAAHRSGLAVHVWTVDEPATMEWLLDLGVDGIMTDRPTVLRDVLRRRGQWQEAPYSAQ